MRGRDVGCPLGPAIDAPPSRGSRSTSSMSWSVGKGVAFEDESGVVADLCSILLF